MEDLFDTFILQLIALHQLNNSDHGTSRLEIEFDPDLLNNLYVGIANLSEQHNYYYFECRIDTYKSTLHQRYSIAKKSHLGLLSLMDFVLTERDGLINSVDLVFGYPKNTFDTPETGWIYDDVLLNRKLKIHHLEEILIRDLNESELETLNDRQKILLLFESGALDAMMKSYKFKNKSLSIGKLAELLSLIFPIKPLTIKPMINPLFNIGSTSNSLLNTEINNKAVMAAIRKFDLTKNEGDPSKK